MKTLGRHIIIIAVTYMVTEALKGFIRSKPEWHMKFVDKMFEDAKVEQMKFERLHMPKLRES